MRFLITKLGHLGDVLVMTAAVRALREAHPQSEIDVVVRRGTEVMLQGNADINRIFLVPGPKAERSKQPWYVGVGDFFRAFSGMFLRGYDAAFDLSNSDRARFWMRVSQARVRAANNASGELGYHASFYTHLSLFKWAGDHQVRRDFHTITDCYPLNVMLGALQFTPQAKQSRLEAWLPKVDFNLPFAVIHPTSRWAFKQWDPERWAAVADRLRVEWGLQVIVSTGPGEREAAELERILAASKAPERIHATRGQLTLHELGLLLGQAQVFLGVDTVAMHLAAAMRTPSVALFGPSTEVGWGPWKTDHRLVLGPCECKLTRKFICDKSKLFPCMASITADAVMKAVNDLLLSRGNKVASGFGR